MTAQQPARACPRPAQAVLSSIHLGAPHDAGAKHYTRAFDAATKSPEGTPPRGDSSAVFPPYGTAKGQPVAGSSRRDLEFYKRGCERTLEDESAARWHAKEESLLAAIDAELSAKGWL